MASGAEHVVTLLEHKAAGNECFKIKDYAGAIKAYGEAGLLCGADGLPHLIVDGNLEHLGEFAIPGLGFLYVAGWIGYAGRSYVMLNKEQSKKPTEGEIIIEARTALRDPSPFC